MEMVTSIKKNLTGLPTGSQDFIFHYRLFQSIRFVVLQECSYLYM
jgi:hypothetical protein